MMNEKQKERLGARLSRIEGQVRGIHKMHRHPGPDRVRCLCSAQRRGSDLGAASADLCRRCYEQQPFGGETAENRRGDDRDLKI